jgi:hypothetical protein
MQHGFCFHLAGYSDFKGYKIVTERCHLVSGVEDGTFESPSAVSRNFADGDYSDAAGSWDSEHGFAVVLAGGTSVLGGLLPGAFGATENFRVTASLIRLDSTEKLVWQDIFSTMLVRMVH